MTEHTQRESRKVTVGCQFCLTLNRVDVSRLEARPKCGECGRPMLLDRPVKITGDNLPHLIKDAEVPIVVDFYADWCGPCKVMAPVLDDFAHAHIGEVLVAKLDTDLNPQAIARYGIRGIPTLIVFRDGQEVARRAGAIPRGELEGLLGARAD